MFPYDLTKWRTYPYTTEPTSSLGEPEYTHEFTYDNAWKDKLISIKVIAGDDFFTDSITYDEIGNPTLFLSKEMTWSGRELTSHDGVTYKYNADGLRTSKKLEDGKKIEYYYSGNKLVFEHREINYEGNPDGLSMFYTYDDGGNISNIRYIIDSIGYEHNYYPVCNSRGDVVEIYSYYGVLTAKYTYDTWGEILSITDANGNDIYDPMHIGTLNPFRYRGYYYDTETGSYYLQSRYYDPGVKRFFNADVVIDDTGESVHGCNLFTYCNNSPVMLTDQSGFAPTTIRRGAIGSTVSELQQFLNSQGYSLAVDGIFGTLTESAVIGYQKANGLLVDGIVGPQTWGSVMYYKEHSKNPSPSNRNKHEKGKARKQLDYGREKGDARRTPNPNKRRSNSINSGVGWEVIGTGVAITGASIGAGYLIYRGARMLPSLLPPLWWTIPGNLVIP